MLNSFTFFLMKGICVKYIIFILKIVHKGHSRIGDIIIQEKRFKTRKNTVFVCIANIFSTLEEFIV